MTDLIKRMEEELQEGKMQSDIANDRLEKEHERLLELQRAVKVEG